MRKAFSIAALVLGITGCAVSATALVFGAISLKRNNRRVY